MDPSFSFRLEGRGGPEENTSIPGGVQGQGGSEQPGLERCPCLWQWAWTMRSLKVLSNPNCSDFFSFLENILFK